MLCRRILEKDIRRFGRPSARLPYRQSHGAGPRREHPPLAPGLSRCADRGQQAYLRDAEWFPRHHDRLARSEGRRYARHRQTYAELLYGADGSLAGGDGNVRPDRQDSLLGRCVRYLRCAGRRCLGYRPDIRPYLGRDAPLLRQHRRQVWQSGAEGFAKALRLGYPDDMLDTRSGLDEIHPRSCQDIRPTESLRRRGRCRPYLRQYVWQYGADGGGHRLIALRPRREEDCGTQRQQVPFFLHLERLVQV